MWRPSFIPAVFTVKKEHKITYNLLWCHKNINLVLNKVNVLVTRQISKEWLSGVDKHLTF
jgi:hypothetical protein